MTLITVEIPELLKNLNGPELRLVKKFATQQMEDRAKAMTFCDEEHSDLDLAKMRYNLVYDQLRTVREKMAPVKPLERSGHDLQFEAQFATELKKINEKFPEIEVS